MSKISTGGLSFLLFIVASLLFFASCVVYVSYANIGTRPVDLATGSIALIITLFLFLLVPKKIIDRRQTRKKWVKYEIEAKEIEGTKR